MFAARLSIAVQIGTSLSDVSMLAQSMLLLLQQIYNACLEVSERPRGLGKYLDIMSNANDWQCC